MRTAMNLLTVLWVTAVGFAMGPACSDGGLGVGGDAGTRAATGGVASGGGAQPVGGAGGAGGTIGTAPVATGGTAGIGGGGNTYTCPRSYPSGASETCFDCQTLPPGSTEGCGVPTRCGDADTSSPTHYPIGCHIVFPWQSTSFYRDYLEEAECYVGGDGKPYWQCLL
jgi:hypothetical protein